MLDFFIWFIQSINLIVEMGIGHNSDFVYLDIRLG